MNKKSSGFTEEERAAMKERGRELKGMRCAAGARTRRTGKAPIRPAKPNADAAGTRPSPDQNTLARAALLGPGGSCGGASSAAVLGATAGYLRSRGSWIE
jgi:hypothetical protein